MTIAQAIKRLQAYPADKACAMCLWLPEDVMSLANEMEVECSEKEASEIMHKLDHNQDAGIGINWDVLESHIWALEANHEEESFKPESET